MAKLDYSFDLRYENPKDPKEKLPRPLLKNLQKNLEKKFKITDKISSQEILDYSLPGYDRKSRKMVESGPRYWTYRIDISKNKEDYGIKIRSEEYPYFHVKIHCDEIKDIHLEASHMMGIERIIKDTFSEQIIANKEQHDRK